jgi:glycosyltransferase involved in cell wall biosynthesis
MADALARLARNPELRASLGRSGREHVVPRYRVGRLVDDVDDLYRELLSARGLPQPQT